MMEEKRKYALRSDQPEEMPGCMEEYEKKLPDDSYLKILDAALKEVYGEKEEQDRSGQIIP